MCTCGSRTGSQSTWISGGCSANPAVWPRLRAQASFPARLKDKWGALSEPGDSALLSEPKSGLRVSMFQGTRLVLGKYRRYVSVLLEKFLVRVSGKLI